MFAAKIILDFNNSSFLRIIRFRCGYGSDDPLDTYSVDFDIFIEHFGA